MPGYYYPTGGEGERSVATPVPESPPPPPPPQPNRSRVTFQLVRDVVLFTVGIAGIIYEVLAHEGQNAALLVLFSGMAGLPAFLYGDARRNQAAASAQAPLPPTGPPRV